MISASHFHQPFVFFRGQQVTARAYKLYCRIVIQTVRLISPGRPVSSRNGRGVLHNDPGLDDSDTVHTACTTNTVR